MICSPYLPSTQCLDSQPQQLTHAEIILTGREKEIYASEGY